MSQDLVGRQVAITGGVGGIGLAIGHELASRGADVVLIDIVDEIEAAGRIADLGPFPGTLRYDVADTTDPDAIGAALARVQGLDTAIGNAGIVRSAPFLKITTADWEAQLDVNLTGVFHLTQAAARQMVAAGTEGRIILTGSWIGSRPWPETSAYSVSKAGLEMLARSAALELAPHRIRVNVLAPGIVNTGLAARQYREEPQYRAKADRAIPLGALQSPREVAQAAAILCSPAADYITGTVLLADGGCSLLTGG
ncbi:SDR family NAD(P)-dependent oxidoreductase [Streptomyces cavernae]|uniref:SDR family NAD(P)-dependent oxidoreductase n=1 Tax=Streptomyces cavernae TaxID=2259034 RepID=UPI001390A42F|nr:SDR family NAD(P)-dependent oxidoreductase [Streptomyces cavernae]